MIINAGTILLTLLLIVVAAYVGLKFVRAFALQIARENHDALLEMDRHEEAQRLKRQQRDADSAAESAFAKVRPILTAPAPAATPAAKGGAGGGGGAGTAATGASSANGAGSTPTAAAVTVPTGAAASPASAAGRASSARSSPVPPPPEPPEIAATASV
jgi:cytoskeletal protein RodZ